MKNSRSENARDRILNKLYTILNEQSNVKILTDLDKTEDKNKHKYNDFFSENASELDILFAQEFFKLGGKFVFCKDEDECFEKLNTLIISNKWKHIFCKENNIIQRLNKFDFENFQFADIENANLAITTCELLIARTGSIVISSFGNGDRTSSAYSPIHICIAYNYQLVYDIEDAILYYKKKYSKDLTEVPSFFSFITGPSKTADIEKTLVKGVHGPSDIYVFFIDK